MSLNKLEDLNDMHMDVLREIGNIGSGNAATSLSTMLGTMVDISVPHVKALSFEETINFMGGVEKIVSGILIKFTGDISGLIMYILQEDFAKQIVMRLYGKELDSLINMDEMDMSAVGEIGNIMAGSYVNAISAMTGLTIDISVPSVSVDFAGAILSVPAIEYASLGDKLLFVDDNFNVGSGFMNSNMLLIPDINSLDILFSKLGIEV